MAVSYATGSAADPVGLLAALATFAAAHGWTVQNISGGKAFSLGANHFALAADNAAATLTLRGCTGVDVGATEDAQPGASPYLATSNALNGPFTGYHFFTDGANYLHGVVEVSGGIFKPFALGTLNKYDTTAGGQYASAVKWFYSVAYTNYPESYAHDYLFDSNYYGAYNSHVRADLAGQPAPNWMPLYSQYGGNNAIGCARPSGLHASLLAIGYQRYNQLPFLLPVELFGDRAANVRSPLGYVSDLRLVNLRLLIPKQVVTIGADNWMVFPAIRRTDTWDDYNSAVPSSGYYGYAFKR